MMMLEKKAHANGMDRGKGLGFKETCSAHSAALRGLFVGDCS